MAFPLSTRSTHRSVTSAAVLAATAALIAGTATTASADPVNAKSAELVPLVCDNGAEYTVVINGRGEFTPAHDLASNAVLVPVAFGEFRGVVTDSSGNQVDSVVEPARSKGSSASGAKQTTWCHYTFDFTEGGFTFHGEGSVLALITPSRR